jgi:hypothetical protein
MSQQATPRREIEDALIAKAEADPAFRKALIKDAKKAIEAEFGMKFPPGMELKVLEETPLTNYLVLPPALNAELSDNELDAASGGWMFSYLAAAKQTSQQDTTQNKAKTADKAFNAMDAYIRG